MLVERRTDTVDVGPSLCQDLVNEVCSLEHFKLTNKPHGLGIFVAFVVFCTCQYNKLIELN